MHAGGSNRDGGGSPAGSIPGAEDERMAATRQDAGQAFDHCLTKNRPKYPKAAEGLDKDRNPPRGYPGYRKGSPQVLKPSSRTRAEA